jgi:two-component SAPR family response regulator
LYIKGNNSLIDERSSYNVFDKVTPTFKDSLSIDFEIAPEVGIFRGYIVRIKNTKSNTTYNVSYNGQGESPVFSLNHEGKDVLTTITLDRNILEEDHWIKIHIKFDMQNDSVNFRVNDKEASTKLEQENTWKPSIYFGRSEHVIDVPPFSLRNLLIKNHEKRYYFPLNESEGEAVHEADKRVIGHVINPTWLINNAYYWESSLSFSSNKVAGSNFNIDTQTIYYFNEDSITFYNIRTQEANSYKYINQCPVSMRLGTNFIDYENNRLYVYEVADLLSGNISIAYLDLNLSNLHWTSVTSDLLPKQLHHHSSFMDIEENRYIIFGGFGNNSYYNNFFSFNLPTSTWDKLEFEGDQITPRYFTSMGYNKNNRSLYLFGGMGNESGDQTVGRVYYYELYKIDLVNKKITKLWEIPWNNENVVPVQNMIITDDESFYTLCYPEHFSHSYLRLYRFSIADGKYEILGDSISILSEKITTHANLYYNSRSNELFSIVQEFDYDDIASTAKVYSLSFPPVTKEQLILYAPSTITNWVWILSSIILVVVMLLIIIYLLKIRKQKSNNDNTSTKSSKLSQPATINNENKVTKYLPNSIYLFGEFSMIDKNTREINYLLSAKLKQAFFLILFHSLENGITSQEFSEVLWPNKSYDKAKNSRGVTLNNLRKILSELNGINLVHEKGIYKIIIAEECYCDYLRCLEIASGDKPDDHIDEFVSIISRGKFLKSEDAPMYDSFKEYIERRIESIMYFYMEKAYTSGKYQMTILLCESIFDFDPLSEEALHYIIKALSKLEMKDEAKRRYYLFAVEYKKTMGEEYAKAFTDLSK